MAKAATRWVQVGASAAPDASSATAEAASIALAGLAEGAAPGLVVVFASAALDFDGVAAGVASAISPDVPVVGCSAAGGMPAAGVAEPTVVVAAIGGEGLAASAAGVGVTAPGNLREAAEEAAACLGDVADRPHRVLLLFTDGAGGDQQEVVRGAYSVAGAGVPLVGASAARRGAWRGGVLLHGGTLISDGVVAAAIGSDAPLGVAVRHGWRAGGDPLLVTAATGNRVRTLDGQPALDRYLERLEAPEHLRDDAAAFAAFALTRPLGLRRGAAEPEVRRIAAADLATRELLFSTEVPNGCIAWPLQAVPAGLLEAGEAAVAGAVDALGPDATPAGVLAFGGDARRAVLADRLSMEGPLLSARAGGAPVAGMYTSGQVARVCGIAGFHNQSLAVLAVAA